VAKSAPRVTVPFLTNQPSRHVVVDGFNFALELHHELSSGKGGHAVVSITDKDGKPVRNLEPIMGAFAHGVGFSKDLESVLHVHPHGDELPSKEERAGPEISFHISPTRPGFHRLYVQVKIDGREVFVETRSGGTPRRLSKGTLVLMNEAIRMKFETPERRLSRRSRFIFLLHTTKRGEELLAGPSGRRSPNFEPLDFQCGSNDCLKLSYDRRRCWNQNPNS
jgi:hypothetical protein